MKRQINYALFLLFLLVTWLFTNTGIVLYKTLIQQKDITLRYDIQNGGSAIGPILYDRVSGETWKYYQSTGTTGKVSDEGWMRVYYKDMVLPTAEGISEMYTVTPGEMIKKQKSSVQAWVKKYKGNTQEIGKVVEMKNLGDLLKAEQEKEEKS